MGRAPALRIAALGAALSCRGATPDAPDDAEPESPVVAVRDGGSVISAPRRPADGCPAREPRPRWGAGTTHGATVASSERWTRAGSPHRVPFGVHLLAGASVRIDPCAVVLVGAERAVVVQSDARLIADGSAAEPITFDALDDTSSRWIGLEIRARALPDTRLTHVTITHAGADPAIVGEVPAAVRTRATGLQLDHVSIRNSGGFGLAAMDTGTFSSRARGLSIEGSQGDGAIYLADVNAVKTLPEGRFVANVCNDVVLAATHRVLRNESTLRALGPGVRYRLRRAARWIVQGVTSPQLIVAPGVTLAFEEDASLEVGVELPGALVAEGDPRVGPPRFVAAEAPARAASWGAVVLGAQTDVTRSRLRDMEIWGAGGAVTGTFETCPSDPSTGVESRGMLILAGRSASLPIHGVRFVDGPRNGFAILRADATPLSAADFTRSSQGNDLTRAGVRCASSAPSSGGRCAPTPGCL
jgi:hypothetical protein